jgi:hypothetical protein
MKLNRLTTCVVTALALTGLSASTAFAIQEEERPAPPSSESATPEEQETNSPAPADEPVAQGMIADEGGQPVQGRDVVLYAWPPTEVLASMKLGETTQLRALTSSVTDAAGKFELRLSENADLRPSKDSSGIINFDVIASDDGGMPSTYAFSRVVTSGGEGRGRSPVLADPGAPGKGRAKSEKLSFTRGRLSGRAATPEAQPVDKQGQAGCTVRYDADLGNRWGIVGATYSTTTGVYHDFGYSQGANSTLGVAVSPSGQYGSFSVNGHSSMSSSGALDFAAQGDFKHMRYKTAFNYARYFLDCRGTTGITFYRVMARVWAGGTSHEPTQPPAASYCIRHAAGTSFTKTTSTAVEWGAGLQIKPVIGIDLYARTGYSSQARAYFRFDYRRNLCGVNDYPGASPSRLVAKDWF